MNKKDMKTKAQRIIDDVDANNKDGGLSFIDLNNAYEEIIVLVEAYNEATKYECEQKLSGAL